MTEQSYDPPRRLTDAEIAARYASDALADGRYALGHAFAAIAMRAKQAEDHRAENDIVSRERSGAIPRLCVLHGADCRAQQNGRPCSGLDERAVLPQRVRPADEYAGFQDAQTAIGEIPPVPETPAEMTARCRFMYIGNQQGQRTETECHQAIWLGPDGQWRHLDQSQFNHPAVPPDWAIDIPRPQ